MQSAPNLQQGPFNADWWILTKWTLIEIHLGQNALPPQAKCFSVDKRLRVWDRGSGGPSVQRLYRGPILD